MTAPTSPIPGAMIGTDEAAAHQWDAIVIGAGMGGGMAGRRLAEHGLSVLFVEKGPAGYRNEEQNLRDDLFEPETRQKRGFWPKQIESRLNGTVSHFYAPLGSGVGGSSVFYASALECPERHDLDEVDGLPHPTGGWPVGYDLFKPYFDETAKLLSLRGEPDPLAEAHLPLLEPTPMCPAEETLFEDLRGCGLHPYRTHEGFRRVPDCLNCIGNKCPRTCKMDGRSAGVEPALETGRARLLTECTVERLVEENGCVARIEAVVDGRRITLKGDTIVLAAGALHSPRLLLDSGLANSSGWVGRGLMFHFLELAALWPRRGNPAVGATRAVSFRDFYTLKGERFGFIQSMGVTADAARIAAFLRGMIARTVLRHLPGIDKGMLLAAAIGERIFGNATVLVCLIDDRPYFDNRVSTHPDDPEMPLVEYTVTPELNKRRRMIRRATRRALGWHRTLMLGFAPEPNYGHPSGTLRFGDDPETSVLDADCKAHDLDNLYVADASFMPTSLGVTPSFTIAANALRVADIVAARAGVTERKTG